VGCGPPSKFRANHALMLRSQDKWLREPTEGEQRRWKNPDFATFLPACVQRKAAAKSRGIHD